MSGTESEVICILQFTVVEGPTGRVGCPGIFRPISFLCKWPPICLKNGVVLPEMLSNI